MHIVELLQGPLPLIDPPSTEGCGAVVSFTGWVRPYEDEQKITALHYEIYEPMTSRELDKLCLKYINSHSLQLIHVRHSVGPVPINACSFQLIIASPHRQEALQAMDAWIDEMKRTIPIWKVPEYSHTPPSIPHRDQS